MMQTSLFSKPRKAALRPTSLQAARSLRTKDITRVQAAICEVLGMFGPATDEDIAWAYVRSFRPRPNASPSSLRTRRSELVRAGKVRDSGRRGKTASGRSCVIWELAP